MRGNRDKKVPTKTNRAKKAKKSSPQVDVRFLLTNNGLIFGYIGKKYLGT